MGLRHRLLRRITFPDAAQAGDVFELVMGSDVAQRPEFIVAGAAELDRARFDV